MERVKILPRSLYMDQIRPFINKNIIKVLAGQRRVGKSYILMAVVEEIKQQNPDANIIEINLENFAFAHIHNATDLYNEISSRIKAGRNNYIFLDEIQEVKDFDKVVRSLILDPHNDIYLTGSNSSMFSSEIASRLAGRCIVINVHALTYREFLMFHSLPDSDGALETYLRYGGLPYLINLPNESTWGEYISGITDAVVYRDVVSRHSLRNTDFLGRLLLFLADNIGCIFNAKKIVDYLKSQHISSSVTSVQAYMGYVAEAFIIHRVRRWDIAGKRFFEIGEKYFFEDLGIRNSIIGYRPGDIGGLIENVVYNHLIAMGYNVKVGVMTQEREIDFIAEKDNELRYIQVAMTVSDENTRDREFGNLSRIPDNYEKTVVTLRDSAPNTYQGIRLMSLREFLMS
ncbi:MAG: ATP-binding protein [Muribaculaceae bacterium]|nr:ATP-binding protein [Muribaculaceae bacterium]